MQHMLTCASSLSSLLGWGRGCWCRSTRLRRHLSDKKKKGAGMKETQRQEHMEMKDIYPISDPCKKLSMEISDGLNGSTFPHDHDTQRT